MSCLDRQMAAVFDDEGAPMSKINSENIRFYKILVCGLPGAGKRTLARLLAPKLGAVVFNADEVR